MNKKIIKIGSFTIIALLIIFALANFQALKDIYVSKTFQPTTKMLSVEKNLSLTKTGQTIFRASMPSLDSKNEFNKNCNVERSETSVLGCFVSSKIHVFDIESEEFPGILESTSAHELLHAVWARMSDKEKSNWVSTLNSVLESSDDNFKNSLALYDDSAKVEEIYVRSATQIKSLPDNLETHFATIFKDQDKVVDFYDSYSKPFSDLEKAIRLLSSEIDSLKEKIESESTIYTEKAKAFADKVSEFNACANTLDCFTAASFNSRRSQLLTEKADIDALYGVLDADIITYNEKVNSYNEKVLYSQSLETIINSNPKPKENI